MNTIIFLLLASLVVASLLVIWFKKDAVVEYGKVLGLSNWMKIPEFKAITENDSLMMYPTFLVTYYNNFFTRLISCPICLSVWLSLLVCIPGYSLPFFYLLPLAVTYVSLFMYFKLVKIMTNE